MSSWRPAALNAGWTYRHQLQPNEQGQSLLQLLSSRWSHSSPATWSERLVAGELFCNGVVLRSDQEAISGDELVWERPPWLEPAVPDQWSVIHDDGDLVVINKPSGLPVMPGGGFMAHTLTALMADEARPVHRLGRFTSGLLLCARSPRSRALLSAQLREHQGGRDALKKDYRALAQPNPQLHRQQQLEVTSRVMRQPHPKLGWVWGPQWNGPAPALSAHSSLTLLETRPEADLLQVRIHSGRPHQIRIHLAWLNTPLLGDPLYLGGGRINPEATPGDGGYLLHAHRLDGVQHHNAELGFTAEPPPPLQARTNSIRREK